jgi:hypothetical protein
MAKYCAYCGTSLQEGQLFCSGCGADLQHASINHINTETNFSLAAKINATSTEPKQLVTRLFDQPVDVLLIDWAFPENKNGKILSKSGELIGEIARTMTEKGIEYTIIDNTTRENVEIKFLHPTHFSLTSPSLGFIADIEKRIVKETLEIRPTPDSTEYFTELENFTMRKTLYEGSEEDEIGFLSRLKDEEKPPNLLLNNPYRLLIKREKVNRRKVLGLVISVLVLFKSNPYQ